MQRMQILNYLFPVQRTCPASSQFTLMSEALICNATTQIQKQNYILESYTSNLERTLLQHICACITMQGDRRIPGNQIMPFGMERMQVMDPFRQIQQVLGGFGGLHHDPILAEIMTMGLRDPFESILGFSEVHKNIHGRGVQGSFACQSFVSSSKIGPDGQVIQENYFENNMGEHRDGTTISQKQQAYKNSQGVNRIAEERMLNDRGRKIVREKIGGNVEETNHYYNIDEEESQKFDSDWRQTDNQLKFLQNHQRYIQPIQAPRQMQVQYRPTVAPQPISNQLHPTAPSIRGVSSQPQTIGPQITRPNVTFLSSGPNSEVYQPAGMARRM